MTLWLRSAAGRPKTKCEMNAAAVLLNALHVANHLAIERIATAAVGQERLRLGHRHGSAAKSQPVPSRMTA